MNRSKPFPLLLPALLLPILVATVLAAAACDKWDPLSIRAESPTAPPPPAPEPPPPAPSPIVVVAAGRVAALPAGIQCTDTSRCTQDGTVVACVSIDWSVTNSTTGVFVGSKTSGPGARVQFDGLAPAAYSVAQVARASDGGTDEEIYNLNVTGLGAATFEAAEVVIRPDGRLERRQSVERRQD